MLRNREQRGVYIGAIIAAVGVTRRVAAIDFEMILLPSLSDMNMMNSGYALQFIGLFVGITGLVMLWFYRARTAALAPTMPSVSFFFEGEGKWITTAAQR